MERTWLAIEAITLSLIIIYFLWNTPSFPMERVLLYLLLFHIEYRIIDSIINDLIFLNNISIRNIGVSVLLVK